METTSDRPDDDRPDDDRPDDERSGGRPDDERAGERPGGERPDDDRRPGPGQDSRVEDWFGQSVQRDADLASELTDELGADEGERAFDELATGRSEQAARHGDEIDPDQGRSAYGDPADR